MRLTFSRAIPVIAGRIQVSEAFRDLVGDAFVFEERGAVDIKGIGQTRTYFLARLPS